MSEPFIDAVDPFAVTEIVDQDNYEQHLSVRIPSSTPITSTGVSRDIIPVDVNQLREVRFTEVAPGTRVPSHSHTGPVFRVISHGDAVINGKKYVKGDWMVIPPEVPYEVETAGGYVALWICIKCQNN